MFSLLLSLDPFEKFVVVVVESDFSVKLRPSLNKNWISLNTKGAVEKCPIWNF